MEIKEKEVKEKTSVYFEKEMVNPTNGRVLIQKMYKPDNGKISTQDRGALLCIGARKWLSEE